MMTYSPHTSGPAYAHKNHISPVCVYVCECGSCVALTTFCRFPFCLPLDPWVDSNTNAGAGIGTEGGRRTTSAWAFHLTSRVNNTHGSPTCSHLLSSSVGWSCWYVYRGREGGLGKKHVSLLKSGKHKKQDWGLWTEVKHGVSCSTSAFCKITHLLSRIVLWINTSQYIRSCQCHLIQSKPTT